MRKTFFSLLTATILALGVLCGTALAEKVQQEKCPVMGGTPDSRYYADYQEKRVYFCCPGCKPEFEKNPEKYMQKMRDEGATIEQAPKE